MHPLLKTTTLQIVTIVTTRVTTAVVTTMVAALAVVATSSNLGKEVEIVDSGLGNGFLRLSLHVHTHLLIEPGPMLNNTTLPSSKGYWAQTLAGLFCYNSYTTLSRQCTHLGLLLRTQTGIWTPVPPLT